MAKMNFTKAQHRAVFYPDGNLLLSAAAGSGKTAALTSRITELVTVGRAEISEMLIVTFTKAAAAEMKTRISSKLREKITEYKGKDSEIVSRLSRALSQLPSADISTIHSFLYKSLKPYFPSLGLSQDASIIEKSEMDAIKAEIMRDTVDDFFEKKAADSSGFLNLADTIGQARDTTAIDRELLWLAQKLSEAGQPISVLTDFAAELEEFSKNAADPFDTPYGERILREIRAFYAHYSEVFSSIGDDLAAEPDVFEKYAPALDTITEWIGRLGVILNENPSYTAAAEHFRSYDQGRLGTLSKNKQTETSELFKKFRSGLKDDIADIAADYFSAEADEFVRSAEKTAVILRSAYTVIDAYLAKLSTKKRSFSILEYGDLETFSTKLFLDKNGSPTDAAKEIGSGYRYVFIDEYQDTNRVQDNIFSSVSASSVRFMVGDIKQSIYRFRGADPRVFSDYRRRWEKATMEGDDINPDGASIFMSENFRCSEDIIRFINAFSDTVLPYGGIPYEKDDALIYAKGEAAPPVPAEVILIDRKTEKAAEAESDTDDKAPVNEEAVYVAGRIREMLGRYSEDGERITKPSDIAILLRSPGSGGDAYRKELEKAGIPVKSKTSKPLGEYPSVMLLVCLLKFIDNPLRDIYTAGVMKSPLFGFSAEDIVNLRRRSGALPLCTAVFDLAGDFESGDALTEKCCRMKGFLDEEKTRLGGISAAKYLESLLASVDFLRLDGIRGRASETDAVTRVTNLARNFDRSRSDRSLHAFIEYLDDFLTEDSDSMENGEEDSVSIMSIHSSKGLEFPVVFLCECAKKRNDQDERRTLLFDDSLGFGMQLPDSTGLVKCDNLIRRSIAAKMAEESKEEEMRMLYVALTRARSKLIVTAKVNRADRWLEEKRAVREFADGWIVKQAASYIDWIGLAVSRGQSRSWQVEIIDAADLREDGNGIFSEDKSGVTVDSAFLAELTERTRFSYAYDFLGSIPAKLIVSRLNPEILDEESSLELSISPAAESDATESDDACISSERPSKRPIFMSGGDDVRANEIGSATHRFLQFADFANIASCGWERELQRLVEHRYLSVRDGEIVNKNQLEKFVSSKLFAELSSSSMVRREFRFNVLVDAAEFTSDAELREKLSQNGVKITVQGVVDCVYRSPSTGKLILIDYKTDSVRSDEWRDIKKAERRLADRHRNQLTYYTKICSDLFGEEISETAIYSTVLGRCIRVE